LRPEPSKLSLGELQNVLRVYIYGTEYH